MQSNIKPRYEVEHVDREVEEVHLVREDGRNVEKKVTVPYGYNVYFPAGHSILGGWRRTQKIRTCCHLKVIAMACCAIHCLMDQMLTPK